MTCLVGLAEGSQYAAAGAILRCHGDKACILVSTYKNVPSWAHEGV